MAKQRLGPRHHDFVGEEVLLHEHDHFRLQRGWRLATMAHVRARDLREQVISFGRAGC